MNYNDAENVPAVWQVGDVILDRYEVKQIFTGGGMGLVFRVYHRGWDMDLAVKSPRPEFFQSQQQIENFEREAETWVNLGLHPHTVSCYYVRRLGGIPRVFVEFVDGGSLADWIRSRRLYEGGPDRALERIVDIAIQFAWGLHYAHEQGLIHQDVKPGNVLVNIDRTVKVTDFGLAKARALTGEIATPSAGQSILVTSGGMTPAYCSPEQANGNPLSRKTDIWSWAISVFEMFVGEPPCRHGGQIAGEVFDSYLDDSFHDEGLPIIPKSLATLIKRCFQRDPVNRPKDLSEVAKDLQNLYSEVTRKAHLRSEPTPIELAVDSLNNRAVSLIELGREKEAERLLSQARGIDRWHPEANYNWCLLMLRQKRLSYRDAIRHLRKTHDSASDKLRAAYLRAHLHMMGRDYGSAIECLQSEMKTGTPSQTERQSFGADEATELLNIALDRKEAIGRCTQSNSISGTKYVDRNFAFACVVESPQLLNVTSLPGGHVKCQIHIASAGHCAFDASANGDFLAVSLWATEIQMWKLQTCELVAVIKKEFDERVLCVSDQGRLLVTKGSIDKDAGNVHASHGSLLFLRNADNGTNLMTFHEHTEVRAAVLSPCHELLLSGGLDGTMRLWKTAEDRCIRKFPRHADGIYGIRANASFTRALTWGYHSLYLSNIESGEDLVFFDGHLETVTAGALSRDGRFVISGDWDGGIRLWDARSGECHAVFNAHKGRVDAVAITEDGRNVSS